MEKQLFTIDHITRDMASTPQWYTAKFGLVLPSEDLVFLLKLCKTFAMEDVFAGVPHQNYLKPVERDGNHIITFWETRKHDFPNCESEITITQMYKEMTTRRGHGYAGWNLADLYNDKIHSWIVVPVI